MFNLLALALVAQATPAPPPSPPRRFCAENIRIEGTPYTRTLCLTRAEWLRRTGHDPLVYLRTVKQRSAR